jgi:hypothetical protein
MKLPERSGQVNMTKRTFAFLLPLLLVVLILSGCGGGSLVDVSPPDKTKVLLSIAIDWDEFESFQTLTIQNLEEFLEVTSVGAWLVYVEENASFSQSVSRELAENEGVITLEVPSTNKADLFVAAVHEGERYNSQRALYLGAIHGLRLEGSTVREITVDDIKWTKAEWHVHHTHQNGYLAGSFIGDKSEPYLRLPIRVRDPYQIGESPSRGNTVIKAAGSNFQLDNPDGWRRIDVAASNDELGETSSSVEWFWPYLDGSLFNLSETYYYIGEEGAFTVHWQ